MSEITPPNEPCCNCRNPSAPEFACTTEYPLRSSAVRKNAVTEGSSSISKIGNCRCTARLLILLPPSLLPLLPAASPETYCPPRSHCSSTESRRRVPAQCHNKC